MAIAFTCPTCQEYVLVDDQLRGLSARCPACSSMVPVPETGQYREGRGGSASREYELSGYDEHPRPREYGRGDDYYYRDRDRAGSWSKVRTGLTLLRSALLIIVFTFLIMMLLGALLAAARVPMRQGGGLGRQDGIQAVAQVLSLVGALTILACIILAFVGQGICCAAPSESRAGGLALAAVICQGLAVLIYLFLIAMLLASQAARFPALHAVGIAALGGFLLVAALGFAGQLLFILFLRAVARFFDDERLSQSASSFLVFHCILFGLGFLALLLIAGLERARFNANVAVGLDILAVLISLVLLVGWIVDLVWFLTLLGRTRNTIDGIREGDFRPRRDWTREI